MLPYVLRCPRILVLHKVDTDLLNAGLAAPSKNTVFEKNVVHIYLIIIQSETSTADWIIVIGHHPVYSSGSHGSEGSTQTVYDHIRSEMVKHKVALYVCGHDHMMEHLTDRM